jgi:hypothetical protein
MKEGRGHALWPFLLPLFTNVLRYHFRYCGRSVAS